VTSRTLIDGDDADRAVSEVVGTALLIGLVVFASFVVVVMGAGPIGQASEQTTKQSAETILQEVDSRLATLSSSSDSPMVELRLGRSLPRNLDTEHFGYLNLTVNRNASCSFQEGLNQIRYVDPEGEQIAYEAGGVFRGTRDSSVVLTSPDVNYRDGALDVTLVNFTGNIDQSVNRVRQNVSESETRTRSVSRALLQGECMRPDNVTLRVKSTFYDAWADHLEGETDGSSGVRVTAHESNQTTVMRLEQDALPRTVDDNLNTIVNLSESPMADYMDAVRVPFHQPDSGTPRADKSLAVSKNAGNNYTVYVEPLSEGSLDISQLKQMNGSVGARAPVDAVLVLDQSGSMNRSDSDDQTRSQEAKAAASNFLADLNESMDRAGVVSYSDREPAYYRPTDRGYYISSRLDASGVNGSIEDIPDYPYLDGDYNHGTDAETGIELANAVFDLRSNETRDKVMILLTDGVNSGCSDTNDDDVFDCENNRDAIDRINHSVAAGVTVYTIGFGDDNDIDEAFLEKAAHLSGGSYHQAENADELDEVFQNIWNDYSNQTFVARTPMTTNVTTGSKTVAPQIAGDTDDIAVSGGFLNVNDPEAPARFSHSFAIQDGEEVTFNVTSFSCEDWEATQFSESNNSWSSQVVRCAEFNESNKTVYRPGINDDDDDLINEGGSDDVDGIYLNGDKALALLDHDDENADWEDDYADILNDNEVFEDIGINDTAGTPDYGRLRLKSNQALVVFDLPDGEETENMMVLLYQVGLSESQARPEGVINVDISEVTFD